jgi:GAF domain-containing protein
LIRDLGFRSGVGAPIIVDGRLWGAAIVGFSRPEPPPPDTEDRLTDFAELVATAVANAEARGELIASRARIVAAGDEAMRRIARPARWSTTTPRRPGTANSVSSGLAATGMRPGAPNCRYG